MSGEEATQAIYSFVVAHKRRHDGNSPSFRQIRKACNISSTSMVSFYLDKLVEEGKITLDVGARIISVVGAEWRMP